MSKNAEYLSSIGVKDMKGLLEKDYAYLKALYKAEVESVDERVGFIIKALEANGLLSKTYILFTSDHGELFGEHGLRGHAHAVYEPLVNVPLIIVGPGIPKGKRQDTVVSLLALMPTLKEILGLTYEDDTQGRSFSALLDGGSVQDRPQYFDRLTNNLNSKTVNDDALLMDGYKLLYHKRDLREKRLLLDISNDPTEINDISKERPEIVRKMYDRILAFREENHKRLEKNLSEIGRDVDLKGMAKRTLKELKALGYVK